MKKNSSKTAFIVKDAKSYVDVEEAWFRFKGEKKGSFLFILLPKTQMHVPKHPRKMEMLEVLDEDKWEEIIWIDTWSNDFSSGYKVKMRRNRFLEFYMKYKEFLYNFIDRVRLNRIAGKYKPFPTIVSGHKNTQEHLAAVLDPDSLYLVDAGLSILKRFEPSGFIDYTSWFKRKKLSLRNVMFSLTGLKIFDRNRTTLFTAYSDSIQTNHKIEKNTQNYKRALIQNKKIGDDALWISSPIHEMVRGVSLESYVNYMKISLDLLGIKGTDTIYIPHSKKESSEDVEYIKKQIGCRVDERMLPVEVKVAKYESLPKICISPLSSALVNLDVISEGKIRMCCAWHYEFNCFDIWVNWRKNLDSNSTLNVEFLEVTNNTPPLFGINTDKCADGKRYKDFREWEVSMPKK